MTTDAPRPISGPRTSAHGDDSHRALAFARRPDEVAIQQYPELASAYAATAILDRQAEADGLSPRQRMVVHARVRRNLIAAIERGEIPRLTLHAIDRRAEPGPQCEAQR